MVFLTRRSRFNAAHKLWVKDWSDEKNIEIFGKCANPNFHGHNYTLYVTVKGDPDPVTGMLINAKDLAAIIKSEVIEKLDHNLAVLIWKRLESKIQQCQLHSVKLEETENIYTEYFGS